jgi:muramidase (phage lysozyme)
MVDLPAVPDRIVTSAAPTSSVSRQDIIGETDRMASAMGKVADATMDIATKQAKEQAADDLQRQKVTLNADGSVNVENPANSLIFGRAGEQYHAAVQAGTLAQHSNIISTEMNDLHQQYPTDPAAFKTAADSWKAKYLQQHGGGEVGEALRQQADQVQTQHGNAITNVAANLDVTNQQKSIQATITDQKNTLQGLARQPGGTDTPEFKRSLERMEASYQALGSNPLFKMPQDQIDLEVKSFKSLLQGEALVSHIDETFTKKGKGDAQKALTEGVLQNPNLSEMDRNRLYAHGMARLQYLTADSLEKIQAGKEDVTLLKDNLASGKIAPTDPLVGMGMAQAMARGDGKGAHEIYANQLVAQHRRGLDTLPLELQAQALGVNQLGAVNTSIPVEGRALLDHIAGPESGGRYDVRYGGKWFQGYGDHPRVAEPITSGPDAGNVSTATGRYQFIAPTWDAQKQKLGLADFSPANQDAAAWDLAQTEYKTKTGKDLLGVLKSGDQAAIADVPRQLSGQWSSLPGGRQPAAGGGGRAIAPSANGGPGFTYEQVQRNPYLISAAVRAIAADESTAVPAARLVIGGVNKAIDSGVAPSADDVALGRQKGIQYPEKLGAEVEAMDGRLNSEIVSKLPAPEREALTAQYREMSNGQDQHHQRVAAAFFEQQEKSKKRLNDAPFDEAAHRGWITPVAPIDPGKPESIPAALAQRVAASERIAAMNHSPPPPVLDKSDLPQLQAALEGPAGAQVLANIAAGLNPDQMTSLLEQKGFTDSLTGLMSSKDPAKMSVAMGVADKLWRDNPADAKETLGDSAITKLQAWQGLRGTFNAVELAEKLNMSDEPSTLKAREAAKEAAETETKALTPSDMAYKLGTSWGIPLVSRVINLATGATPSAPFDAIKGGELAADYRATYTALRSYGVEADKASNLAVDRLKSTWGASEAAGNQVMKNPPERYYPAIGGSHDWMKPDLSAWIEKRAGAEMSADRRSLEAGIGGAGATRNWTLEGLISNGQTAAEIASGRPPSYEVAIRRKDGTLDILAGRVFFDPSDHIAKHGDSLQKSKQAADFFRNLDPALQGAGGAGITESPAVPDPRKSDVTGYYH